MRSGANRTIVTAFCATFLAACASEPAAVTATGALSGSGALVGVVTDGDRIAAYVCDGSSLATWFSGDVVDGAFELESPSGLVLSGVVAPDALDGVVAPDAITGTLTRLDGTVESFSADGTDAAGSGIWRVEVTVEGEAYVGGWVVAPDGTQQGALIRTSTSTIVESPTLSITDGTSNTIVGTLEVDHIVSPRDIMPTPMI